MLGMAGAAEAARRENMDNAQTDLPEVTICGSTELICQMMDFESVFDEDYKLAAGFFQEAFWWGLEDLGVSPRSSTATYYRWCGTRTRAALWHSYDELSDELADAIETLCDSAMAEAAAKASMMNAA